MNRQSPASMTIYRDKRKTGEALRAVMSKSIVITGGSEGIDRAAADS
jgi:hypothetical protein